MVSSVSAPPAAGSSVASSPLRTVARRSLIRRALPCSSRGEAILPWLRAVVACLPAAYCARQRGLRDCSRRHWLQIASFLGTPLPAAAESVQETVAEMTKSILGSDNDVHYPSWFLGDWEATTELAAIEFPQGEKLAGAAAVKERASLGTARAIEQYPQRYMEFDKQVIADRAFNMRGYIRGSGGGPRAFESVDWSPERPNTTTVTIKRDGISRKTETRITKRSVATPDGREDLFNTSEVFLQVVSGSGSLLAPGAEREKVTPVRCVNKFKRVSESEIQVLQRLEVFPRLDGAAVLADGSDPEKPTVVYKYRGVLKKEARSVLTPSLGAL